MVRSCYKTRTRFFLNDETEVTIRWYRCPPGTPWLPYYTRFASGNWAYERAEWPGTGEVLDAPRPWQRGDTPPSARARHICGTREEWATGLILDPLAPPVLYDVWGIPLCCETPTDFSFAGLVLDAPAETTVTSVIVGDAGLSLGGVAFIQGENDCGTASVTLGPESVIEGIEAAGTFAGLEMDGDEVCTVVGVATADAGLEWGGAADIESVTDFAAVAGLEFDGPADTTAAADLSDAVAGLEFDGAAAETQINTLLLDYFVDANGTDLSAHTPDFGGPWNAGSGIFTIQGNKAQKTTGTSANICTADIGREDFQLTLTANISAGGSFQLILRRLNGNNFWFITIQATGITCQQRFAGVFHTQGTSSTAINTAADIPISVVFNGANLDITAGPAHVNCNEFGHTAAANLMGWTASVTGATVDDWSARTLEF